ncbi:DUF945 family protein [Sulfurimonas sp.]|uniref:DUF945 family protein n=1 Tax=Sulfurimonas sp. TaxID=2022749 RepID=UPI0025CDA36F|nr:DUF945 family protein [Sulfurimonas sp.]MBT5934066.1 hypothetical protein [Sulfurimonas sp.]
MKKSILVVVILLSIIAILPIIGNTFITKQINERLVELESLGLKVSKDESESSYLHSSRHFEFLLKDSKEFIEYLKQYSNEQIPPYVKAMLDGVLVGADVEYSNLPFAKAFEIEIYPMKLSAKMSDTLQQDNVSLYEYIEKFLAQKGVLYHIEYNLLNSDFKGYLKDVDETYTLDDTTELTLSLEEAKFKGNGALLAPNELVSKIKKLHFNATQKENNLNFHMNDFKSTSNFESANTYITNIDIDETLLELKGDGRDVDISMDSLRVNASSNDQGTTTQINSKSSIKDLKLATKEATVNLEDFNFDIAINGLDKQEHTKFMELVSQNYVFMTPESNQALSASATSLLSKGLEIEVADFSIKKFAYNVDKKIKGFKVQTVLKVKEDLGLAKKMQISPLMALPNIGLESELRISKEMYTKVLKRNGLTAGLAGFEKEDGDDYLFIVKFADTKLSINGKSLN